jgi:predicted permease
MTLFARLRSWLFGIAHRSTAEREMDEELRFHVESYEAALVREGVPRAEARRRARAEFGGLEARKEDCREARGLRLVDEARGDVRYALRQLRRAPMFTAVAILSLGLGIGANTAIFSLMEQALWKSMPVKNPERLRLFTWVSGPRPIIQSEWGSWSRPFRTATGTTCASFSYEAFQALQQRAAAFEQVFAFKPIGRVTAVVNGQAELVVGQLVSGTFYQGLALAPVVGRAIEPSDDEIGAGEVAGVISDGFWARRFGRDPAIIGRSISINQVPVTIVGVNPPGFTGIESGEHPDIFLPLTAQPRLAPQRWHQTSLLHDPDEWWVEMMGRLKADASDAQAQSETDAILQQVVREMQAAHPDRAGADLPHMRLLTGSRGIDNLREEFAQPLLALLSFVTVVLLIACANVANLLLARAGVRSRELGLRLALGAGRARISRQLLTEGLTLGVGGGLLGVLIGYWSRDAIPVLLAPSWRTDSFQIRAAFDTRVLVLAVVVTIATSVLFSLAPIWQSMRTDLNTALKNGGRTAVRGAAPLRGKALIVFQVGLSVLLLIAAGLFVRTLSNIQSVNLGFTPARILLFTMDPPRTRYIGHARAVLFDRIYQEVAVIPGVEAASLSGVPLVGAGQSRTGVMIEDQTRNDGTASWVNDVGHRFMETMGIPILAGRSFDAHDSESSPLVAIVNQRWARQYYPSDPNPLGRTFRNNGRIFQIIGICGDTHYDRARNDVPPTFYRLMVQNTDAGAATFELRTAVTTAAIMKSVRRAVDRVDKELPVFDVRTQMQQIDATMSSERLFATLTVAFGVLALLLASIGIYGLMAHNVTRRIGEIGVRIALGARRLDILLMVLREATWLAVVGVVMGVLAAVWLARYVESMLFGVRPVDPITIGGAIGLMLLVALSAGWLPARRASRLDAMVALRHD